LVISNHNSFGVLFDKIASVYFIFEKYIDILALEVASPCVTADFRSVRAFVVLSCSLSGMMIL